MHCVIATPQAPAAIGPYSQAVRAGDLLFVSGQIPLSPATGELVAGDISAQAAQCCRNIAAILDAAGLSMASVVKLTVFLTDMSHFPQVNAVCQDFFSQPYPARACVAVAALPRQSSVEMEVIASFA